MNKHLSAKIHPGNTNCKNSNVRPSCPERRVKAMLKNIFGGIHHHRIFTWFRRVRTYGDRRKQSDYRAASMAQRLVLSGALQSPRLNGSPLARYAHNNQGGKA